MRNSTKDCLLAVMLLVASLVVLEGCGGKPMPFPTPESEMGDRPGLLYELTTAISKLNLNIASAHVATFGERARDVFYVTDLLGAQINAPTRQAAIKSALVHLLAHDEVLAQPAA